MYSLGIGQSMHMKTVCHRYLGESKQNAAFQAISLSATKAYLGLKLHTLARKFKSVFVADRLLTIYTAM